MATAGSKVSDDGIVETFGNDDEAFEAVDNGVVVRVSFDSFPLHLLHVLVEKVSKFLHHIPPMIL